jgi:hypothetical protein
MSGWRLGCEAGFRGSESSCSQPAVVRTQAAGRTTEPATRLGSIGLTFHVEQTAPDANTNNEIVTSQRM